MSDVGVAIRLFNGKTVIETSLGDKYKVSKYFPAPMKDALRKALSSKGYIRGSDYIICPVYSSKDIQFGVTGSVEEQETSVNGLARELGEEIGIVPKDNYSPWLLGKYNWSKNREFTIYEVYIKHCMPVAEHQNGAVLSKTKDDRSKKVGGFVYGTKKDVLDFLESEKIFVYKSGDDIVGIAAIKANDMLNFV
jgi:hypothetical protein